VRWKVRRKTFIIAIVLMLMLMATTGCSKPVTTTNIDTTENPEPLSDVPHVELPVDFPENLRWLTDEEKNRITEIALSTESARERLQQENHYETSISWIALTPGMDGEDYAGYQVFEYDTVAKGIPRGTVTATSSTGQKVKFTGVPDNAEIYPYVFIWFGAPKKWVVAVAVNVETGKVMYEEEYPYRTGPTITTGNEAS
jgi:hypothetical protein